MLEAVELAVLDRRFEVIAARLPGVMSELVARQARQARALATHRAVLQVPGLANRLLLMIWCLAERWGRVLPDGRLLPLRLTHGTLSELVGARRPSVTLALHELVEAGRVARAPDGGWIVRGAAPLGPAEVQVKAAERPLASSLAANSLLLFAAIATPLAALADAVRVG